MWNKNIETFLGCDATFEEADTVLFGAPYDCTTSYRPGTRFARHTMRGESYGIETYSPYQDKDLDVYKRQPQPCHRDDRRQCAEYLQTGL